MKKITIGVLIIFLWQRLSAHTFINSLPMRAKVFIDGKYSGVTPLLLKDALVGTHSILFEHPGSYSSEINVTITDDVTNINTILTPQGFSLYLPGQKTVILDNTQYKNQEIKNLPQGFYYFKPNQDAISIERINPNKRYLYLSLGLAGTGLLMSGLGLWQSSVEYTEFQEAMDYWEVVRHLSSATFWDNLTVVGLTFAGLGSGLSIYFWIDDINYHARNKNIIIESTTMQEEDIALYEKGMDLLNQGNYQSALQSFENLIRQFPASRFLPASLLQSAELYAKDGNYQKAVDYLTRIKNEYPIYEIYELTLRQLANNYAKLGKYDKALDNLNEINDINSIYTKQQTDYLIIDMLYRQYHTKNSIQVKQLLQSKIDAFLSNAEYDDESKNTIKSLKIN